MENEIWKDVKGYEGLYKVSNLGRVKSFNCFKNKKAKILKPYLVTNKYVNVKLAKKGKNKQIRVHQLVAIAFLNHKVCGLDLVVNHKNFNRQDNRVKNLEIVTVRENTNRNHLKSTSKYTGVSWYKPTKKWVSTIRINNKKIHLGYYLNEYEAHLAYQNKLKEITA